jgi:hypothetical protein
LDISDLTFWLAFYALVVGALGDTYAVIIVRPVAQEPAQGQTNSSLIVPDIKG